MKKLYGLIPAAGMGTRARPYTEGIPKSMLEINGEPNLQRTIKLMRDQLGISDIVIVIGYFGQVIKDYFADGAGLGVRLHYIENTELEKGLAWSVACGGRLIDDYFCVILSDECYVNSNHFEVSSQPYRDSFATCFIKEVDDTELIKKNYSVALQDNRIERLIEKPTQVDNDILGCGTFILSPELFPALDQAFLVAETGYVEFLTFLNDLCQQGKIFTPFWLTGSYVNINDRDSLRQANYHERSQDFTRVRKAMLIYSEGHEKNICFTIKRYQKHEQIDQLYLLVPRNNSIADKARALGVQVLQCPDGVELYGEKMRYGIGQIQSDIIMLTEADYAFPARDIDKLLAYLPEADLVMGTRTSRQLMEQGVDLEGLVRFANIFIAKLVEVLWWHLEGRFTDVGCTFRAFWKSSYVRTAASNTAIGPEFSVEMMISFLEQRMRVLEIPVNYRNVSRALSSRYRNRTTFFRFLGLVLKKRLFFR